MTQKPISAIAVFTDDKIKGYVTSWVRKVFDSFLKRGLVTSSRHSKSISS